MVNANINTEQAEAQEVLDALGFVGKPLKPHELNKFSRSFDRQFVGHYVDRQISEIMLKHRAELLMGAMIAKEQMEAEIDGEQPAPGKIGGPLAIRAAWFGIGDSWQDIRGIYAAAQNSWSTGSAQNWIHSGTSLLAGTAGNAVKILENAVHVIVGVGSLHASPKIETIQFTIDNKTKPIINLERVLQIAPGNQLRIRELDDAIILKKNQTFKAQVFISEAFGAASDYQQDYPFLVGASYISEDGLRLFDPTNIPGTTHEIVNST